ncbi:VQ motif-containing protein 8, chloroplastic-like [Phalaenopsis equestris]|uniref:VQ motif-containing protein 8, chloroplastic-like n=1 Tax=Phalaenopsis equestris TaxID=78828 RepID=UPI0009E2C826|nr:VQ motif-containing protein 8, chloroplastic-like [Phalaenopsis equestris]
MPSSSSTRALQSPSAHLLKLSENSWKTRKATVGQQNPVIVYLQPPKVIFADPKNFRSLVQKLTGKDSVDSPASTDESSGEDSEKPLKLLRGNEGWRSFGDLLEMEDALLLRLGKS